MSNSLAHRLQIYGAIGMAAIVFSLVKQLFLVSGVFSSGKKLHNQLLDKIMRLPMSFYDSQPTGRW